jgi:hypothetical protein
MAAGRKAQQAQTPRKARHMAFVCGLWRVCGPVGFLKACRSSRSGLPGPTVKNQIRRADGRIGERQ